MMKQVIAILTVIGLTGCSAGVPPEMVKEYQGRALFTCCNVHYESSGINDANYYVGSLLPLGTPAQVQNLGRHSVTFSADGRTFTLDQSYGSEQESFRSYLDKVLVPQDPHARLQTYPAAVQAAIREARVERGMTRDQVVMSLGYPPTHRTPSLNDRQWTYWYNRWVTFKVVFNDAGKVESVIGSPAPTINQPIPDEPAPRPSPAPVKRHR